jgi:MoCo/4Fe-4S cofactor protein with predicted Tat translocation signal
MRRSTAPLVTTNSQEYLEGFMSEEIMQPQQDEAKKQDVRYWQNLEQWSKDPEFQKLAETEFRSSPLREAEMQDGDRDGGWARREFLKLMGASLAMATVSCVRRPVQKIIPYNKAPEEVTFGTPNFYTSTYFDGQEGFGVLVKTREGRPIKMEGNPNHPLNKNAISASAQSAVLSLYDPDRLTEPKKNLPNKERSNFDSVHITWEEADKQIIKQLAKGGLSVLTGHIASPTTKHLLKEFVDGFKGKHYVWEPLCQDDIRGGQKASYGQEVVPFFHFDKAKMIVSIDADFLGTWLMPTTFNQQFSAGRKANKNMSKLVVFDSNYSLTGANADLRVRIKPSQQIDAVMGLAHEIVIKKSRSRFAGNATVKAQLAPFAEVARKLSMEKELFAKIADDLWQNRGQSLIVAGGPAAQTERANALQIAVNFLNSVLDNDGVTIDSKAVLEAYEGSNQDLLTLIDEMKRGAVKTLIIHGVNPGYSFANPAFRQALMKVETLIYTGDRIDETGAMSNFVLPDNHQMEGWSDAEFVSGVVSIQQPTIRPLNNTRSFQLSLMSWAKGAKVASGRMAAAETFYDYLRSYWKNEIHAKHGQGKSFETFWDEALQNGVIGSRRSGSTARNFRVEALQSVKPINGAELELVLYPSIALGDGRYANISWLQEFPDPITKICWDNYASVSLARAEKLHVKEGDLVVLKVGQQESKIPVHIQPGLHDDVIAVAVGYGRSKVGKVGNGIGVNAYQFVSSSKSGAVFSGRSADVKVTGERGTLACVAGNNSMEGRKIVVEATLAEYLKDASANNHHHQVFSIWSGHQYNGHKWGMAVDLNSCTGCSACMVACQAENNIPVVGKRYVLQGREMQWLRVDRYFVGDPAQAETVFQPVMCQHCDNAPCETVCPVLATVHNSEGLNDMVYNRCVGTRYCSNNCPYKVRRFNWFNYAKTVDKPLHLAYNPDVTVRTRGVMEKCTFCVHRIKAARGQARVDQRELKDGDVQTACQQSCPTGAIVFGDLNDPKSKVSALWKEKRSYALLEEFNASPSVRYMTKIRNNYQETRHNDGETHGKGGHS